MLGIYIMVLMIVKELYVRNVCQKRCTKFLNGHDETLKRHLKVYFIIKNIFFMKGEFLKLP